MTDDAGNPLADAATRAVQLSVEVATAVAVAAQMALRIARQRAEARAAGDNEVAAHHHEHLRGLAAQGWSPGLDDGFASQATAAEALGVWSAAQPWSDDADAARAAARAEQRLAELHPDLMRAYQDLRAGGQEPAAAMWAAGRATCAPAWAGVLDPDVASRLGVDEALGAWNAARPWAAGDPEAAQAMAAAEARLRRLRPVAMTHYDDHRSTGHQPAEAMEAVLAELWARDARPVAATALGSGGGAGGLAVMDPAGTSFPFPLGDPGASAAAWAVGDDQRAAAARDLHVADDPRTPPDERAGTAAGGADHLEYAEASTARAAALSARSYPRPLPGAPVPRPAPPGTPSPGWSPSPGRRR